MLRCTLNGTTRLSFQIFVFPTPLRKFTSPILSHSQNLSSTLRWSFQNYPLMMISCENFTIPHLKAYLLFPILIPFHSSLVHTSCECFLFELRKTRIKYIFTYFCSCSLVSYWFFISLNFMLYSLFILIFWFNELLIKIPFVSKQFD